MKGLRTQESSNFIKFFEIVQEKANQDGCIFFLDSGEGNDRLFADMEISDLSGWLIPIEESEKFETIFENHTEDDKWIDFFSFVKPIIVGNTINVVFE